VCCAEQLIATLSGHSDTIASITYDPTGEVVATGGMDGIVRVWRAANGDVAGVLQGPSEAIEFIAWHPKGTVLLVGSEDMQAWMFNAVQQQCMQVFTGHTGAVTAGVQSAFGLCRITLCALCSQKYVYLFF
jgi:WD40 repeat protein